MQYEILYLIGESNKGNLEKIKEAVKQTIINEGGSFVDPEITKERKMSYQIKQDIRGIYIAQRFNIAGKDAENYNPATIPNSIKKLNLNPDLLRFIIVNAEELPELKEREDSKEKAKKSDQNVGVKKKEFKKEPARFAAPKTTQVQESPEASKPSTEEEPKEEIQNDIDKKLDEILKI